MRLSAAKIQQSLKPENSKLIESLTVLDEVDSTNLELKRSGFKDKFKVCIADSQTAGKGRQNNTWISPPGSNIYFSLSKVFNTNLKDLSGLSLVAGILCANALNLMLKTPVIKLKWPNDLIARDKKLGGILLENHPKTNKKNAVILGIGINVSMSSRQKIDVPWSNLADLDLVASRNKIIGELLNLLLPTLDEFNASTLEAMLPQWDDLDWIKNQQVAIYNKNSAIYGTSLGINAKGALLLEENGQTLEIHSGDVSLRRQCAAS